MNYSYINEQYGEPVFPHRRKASRPLGMQDLDTADRICSWFQDEEHEKDEAFEVQMLSVNQVDDVYDELGRNCSAQERRQNYLPWIEVVYN